jgi:hypothetical protein
MRTAGDSRAEYASPRCSGVTAGTYQHNAHHGETVQPEVPTTFVNRITRKKRIYEASLLSSYLVPPRLPLGKVGCTSYTERRRGTLIWSWGGVGCLKPKTTTSNYRGSLPVYLLYSKGYFSLALTFISWSRKHVDFLARCKIFYGKQPHQVLIFFSRNVFHYFISNL